MKQIDMRQALDLFKLYKLVQADECWITNQDTGDCRKVKTKDVIKNIDSIQNPVFKTDHDGMIKVVTLDIYYDYRNNNLYTGSIIRIFLHRREKLLQKRIQPISLSNDVGASTPDRSCIHSPINNYDGYETR